MIEYQGFLCHLVLHYIDSTFELQRVGMRTSVVGLIRHVKQSGHAERV